MVTHREVAEKYADTIITLYDGKIQAVSDNHERIKSTCNHESDPPSGSPIMNLITLQDHQS